MDTSAMLLENASQTSSLPINKPSELPSWIDFWQRKSSTEQELRVGTASTCSILWNSLNPCKLCYHLRSWWTTRRYFSFCGKSNKFKRSPKASGSCSQETKAFGCEEPEEKTSASSSTPATSSATPWTTLSTVYSVIWWFRFKPVTFVSASPLTKPPLSIRFSNCISSSNRTSWTRLSTVRKENRLW